MKPKKDLQKEKLLRHREAELNRKACEAMIELKTIIKKTLNLSRERVEEIKLSEMEDSIEVDDEEFTEEVPEPPMMFDIPKPPNIKASKYYPKTNILDIFRPSLRHRKIDEAQKLYQSDFNIWLSEKQAVELENKRAKDNYKDTVMEIRNKKKIFYQTKRNRKQFILKQKKQTLKNIDASYYGYKLPEAILDHCKWILDKSDYPNICTHKYDMDYCAESGILVIDYDLPSINLMPRVKEYKYNPNRHVFAKIEHTRETIEELYDGLIYQVALRTVYEMFKHDFIHAISAVCFNGYVTSINKSTGKKNTSCILSLQVNKNEFKHIDIFHVDPKECFRGLKGVAATKLYTLTPIAPIISITRSDKRFIESHSVMIDKRTNIAAMEWNEFEHLIRELFEKEFLYNGGEVRVTRASRDGGVDAVAFDPDPIRGGKIVIQAKRYTNTVGVSAVRDLYGTVLNEGATKGILVTTANYGPDAYEFAKGKPLTLLNGSNLLNLLEKHGHPAKIDLKEAKAILGEKEK